MSDTILLDSDGNVAVITLNRPDRLNSFNETMHLALQTAMDTVRTSGARCLLLTGAGRGFCAGQDLGDRAVDPGADAPDLGRSIERYYNPLIRGIRSLDMPVVCAVNGVAAGAGANIALACDIVLAGHSASFVQAFCRLGLVPDSGGTYFLPRLVGSARSMGLAMLGDKISAQQAEDWGMIWKTVPDQDLMIEAQGLADHLATQPTHGLALIKRALHASAGHDLDTQLDLERDLQREAGRTSDYREGVSAFLAKRTPTYTGN